MPKHFFKNLYKTQQFLLRFVEILLSLQRIYDKAL